MFSSKVMVVVTLVSMLPNVLLAEQLRETKEGLVKSRERLEVTGSRIRRLDLEKGSPVITISRENIEKSGAGNVADLISSLPISSTGAYSSPTVNDSRGTVTQANLRGLGADRTLILIDGQRLPDEGGLNIVDLSTIPISFIERIEILRDTASAIYGSDAVGGVVNIISRRDFNGSEVSTKVRIPQKNGGRQYSYSFSSGYSDSDSTFLSTLHYQKLEPIYFSQRKWTEKVNSIYSIPGNIILTTLIKDPVTGDYVVDGDGNRKTETKTYGAPECVSRNSSGLCTYNLSKISKFAPESQQLGLLTSYSKNMGDDSVVSASLRIQQHNSEWNMAPNAASFQISPEALAANPYLNVSGSELAPGKSATVLYRATSWGPKTWIEKSRIYGGNISLDSKNIRGFDLRLTLGHTLTHKKSENPSGFFLKDNVEQFFRDASINPFEINHANSNFSTIVNQSAYKPRIENLTYITNTEMQVNHKMFSMSGGDASLAFVVNHANQYYKKTIDSQSEAGNVSNVSADRGASGARQTDSVSAEIFLPMTDKAEIQVNARHDRYSDFGETTNPQVGMKYKISQNILLRGSIGRGFKAPSLDQIYNQGSATVVNLIDSPRGDTSLTNEVELETYGSKKLKPEYSNSKNIGLVFNPIDKTFFSADYWEVAQTGIIRPIDAQRALDVISAGGSVPGLEVERFNSDPKGPLKKIRVPTANLGSSDDAGFQLAVNQKFNTENGLYELKSTYSEVLYSRSVAFPGDKQIDQAGNRGRPKWRLLNEAIWSRKAHSFNISNNIISKQSKKSPEKGYIGSFSTYDLGYTWVASAFNFGFLAMNILDRQFPLDDSERIGDDQRVKELFSSDGRTFVLNLRIAI